MDWQRDAFRFQTVGPFDHRLGLETELRCNRHLGIRALGERLLPADRIHDSAVGAVGIDVLVTLGMPGDMQPFETVEEAALHQLHRVVELACRLVIPTGKQQRLIDASLALIACDPVHKLRFVGNPARREVRHDREAVVRDALGSRDHVLDRRAFDMGDIDPGALGQDRAEILDLLRGARHHLDRKAPDELGNATVGPGRRFARKQINDLGHPRHLRSVWGTLGVRPAFVRDQDLDPFRIVVPIQFRRSFICDSFVVTFDLAHVDFAPFREIGIVILRANLHRASVNGLLEPFGQGGFGRTPPLADDDLRRDVPPINYDQLCHRCTCRL